MLSFNKGRPIGKIEHKPNNKILSIIDPDNPEDNPVKPKYKKIATKEKKCCQKHSKVACKNKACCKKCALHCELESSSSEEEDNDNEEGLREFKTKENIIPLPDLTKRFIEYICGPSGSGKSTIACEIAMNFKKVYPKKKIFIFSRTEAINDPAYSKLEPVQIEINDELITDPIDITTEISNEGCLVIFDDVETIQSDKLKREIQKLMCDMMEVGRKLNINMIVTNHLVLPIDRKFARTLLNEINMITVFPKSGSSQQITYALKTYFGLTKSQIDKIIALKSRYVRISKNYPSYVLSAHEAYIL